MGETSHSVGKWNLQNSSQGDYLFGQAVYNRHQWKLIATTTANVYRIQSVASGWFLDSEDPGTTDVGKWPNQGQYVRHFWEIKRANDDDSFYLRNPDSNKYLDSADPSGHGIGKWPWQNNYIRHKWQLLDVNLLTKGISYTTVQAALQTAYPSAKLTIPLDKDYIPLLPDQFSNIWNQSGLPSRKYREETFDCDDFAWVMKANASNWSYGNIAPGAKLAGFCGFIIGSSDTGVHAFNIRINYLGAVSYFEPQTGTFKDSLAGYSKNITIVF